MFKTYASCSFTQVEFSRAMCAIAEETNLSLFVADKSNLKELILPIVAQRCGNRHHNPVPIHSQIVWLTLTESSNTVQASSSLFGGTAFMSGKFDEFQRCRWHSEIGEIEDAALSHSGKPLSKYDSMESSSTYEPVLSKEERGKNREDVRPQEREQQHRSHFDIQVVDTFLDFTKRSPRKDHTAAFGPHENRRDPHGRSRLPGDAILAVFCDELYDPMRNHGNAVAEKSRRYEGSAAAVIHNQKWRETCPDIDGIGRKNGFVTRTFPDLQSRVCRQLNLRIIRPDTQIMLHHDVYETRHGTETRGKRDPGDER